MITTLKEYIKKHQDIEWHYDDDLYTMNNEIQKLNANTSPEVLDEYEKAQNENDYGDEDIYNAIHYQDDGRSLSDE